MEGVEASADPDHDLAGDLFGETQEEAEETEKEKEQKKEDEEADRDNIEGSTALAVIDVDALVPVRELTFVE